MVWFLDGSIDTMNLDVVYASGRIAMMECENDEISDEQLMANARLIAAAPDMLAALESVIDDLVGGIQAAIDEGGSEAWIAEANGRLMAARAAIAKAKGEA